MDNKEFDTLLKKTGMSQKEFAELIGSPAPLISKWKKSKFPQWVKPLLEGEIAKNTLKRYRDAHKELLED